MTSFPDGVAPVTLEVEIDVDLDRGIGLTIPQRHARGRIVRLGPALDDILSRHAYPVPLATVLAEALTLTALLGSTLKGTEGQLTLQAQTQGGAVDLMVCDYRGGEMRGYLRHDADLAAVLPDAPTLHDIFGKGYLAITFDQAVTGERYQGIVPLDGASLAEAAESYFAQSEQIPSLVRLAVAREGHGRFVAGGLMLQHLPEGEEGRERIHTRLDHPEWEGVAALGQTVSPAELVDPALPLDHLAWRLFNEEEVRLVSRVGLKRGCRCNLDHTRSVIAQFPADERADMVGEDGMIHVDCQFCSSDFAIDPESID